MMKKLLILMLVFGMASLANAKIIDVVTDGVGSMGHAGTPGDRLAVGESIAVKIVLNADPDPTWYYGGGYAGSDGYYLSSMDFKLTASGASTLSEKGTTIVTKMKHNTNFGLWTQPDPLIVGNAIAQISGASLGDGIQGAADLVWNLKITADGIGSSITLDLTHNLRGEYQAGPESWGMPGHGWIEMTEADLGDLTIYQIPEPMTIGLLGLGGLFLRRRK